MSGEGTDERSGAERILEAAVREFGRGGIAATSLKSIAAEAGVSQALIIHHFGSKAALRRACDVHVTGRIRSRKESAMDRGPQLDPLYGLRLLADGRDLMHYLVRALTEGGDEVDDLIDELVADAEDYLDRGVEAGVIRSGPVPREQVVMLTLWSLGTVVLHEHLHRLLGVDLLADDFGPAGLAPYLRPFMELLSRGLFVEGVYEDFLRMLDDPDQFTPDSTAAADNPSDPKD